MSVTKYEVRAGAYYDSVVLMQLQRGLLDLPGVIDAGVVMATPANRDLLAASDLLPAATTAKADDLLIVVKAQADQAASDALAGVDALLTKRRASGAQEFRPRSLAAALKQLPEAAWVLVSVPGRFAAGVAREALDRDLHVFLYSDNVSIEDEVALKQTARAKGLLVMGPDCGTAIINGMGLGFANRVRRGSIGLVAASGTGLQAVTVGIHELGAGVSQAIGTGGRDLKSEVGAITAHQSLDLLARDPETKVIVLVSKPPSADVAAGVIASAQATGKPVVVDFIGYPPPGRKVGNLYFATTLVETAELANQLLTARDNPPNTLSGLSGKYVRGLFSGGTLAYEFMLGVQAILSPIYSNAPITKTQQMADPLHSQAHTIIDLGGDEFTVGRLHPMLDNDLRIRRFKQEAADPTVGLILLDVVLGEGTHPDPASELAPVIKDVVLHSKMEVAAIVIGTEDDPQNLVSQMDRLRDAGAILFRSVTEAVEYVNQRFGQPRVSSFPAIALERFSQPLAAINVGLESFFDSLIAQGAQAVHVEWRPPAGGNEKLASILARMKS
jgi:FdrA protein